MFKYFMQLTLFRVAMVLAACAFVGVFVFAIMLDERNVGPKELRVPAGFVLRKANLSPDKPVSNIDLSIQHLSAHEIGDQLNTVLAEALSFNKDNFVNNSAAVQKYFTQAGYDQYRDFLNSAQFQASIEAQDLQSGAYIEQEPIELAHGVYDGVYKWLFEVPITISLIPRNSESYRGDAIKANNRRFTLRTQFARINDPENPDAVKIEMWQVLPSRPVANNQ